MFHWRLLHPNVRCEQLIQVDYGVLTSSQLPSLVWLVLTSVCALDHAYHRERLVLFWSLPPLPQYPELLARCIPKAYPKRLGGQ